MVTGIPQKSYRALFPSWLLKKKRYIKINEIKNHAEERLLALEIILILKVRKMRNYTYPILHEFEKCCNFRFRINLGVTINVCLNVIYFFKEMFLNITLKRVDSSSRFQITRKAIPSIRSHIG